MSFRVYARNFIAFTLITAVLYIPLIAWMLHASSSRIETLNDALKQLAVVGGLSLFLNSFVTATLTFGVVKDLQGQRASIGACISTGFKRMLPALGVGLLAGLAMVGGFVLLLIPGFIVMCMLYVSTPASVIEKPGVLGALRRSRDLTSGHKGGVFGILFMLWLIGWGISKIEAAAFTPTSVEDFRLSMYITMGIQVILGTLSSVVAAVAYYALRAEKEGTSANELAAVFE
jgi:hypothetical protein